MTDAPTIRYHYKAETVQDLARSLIVASTICDAQGFVRPQFTPAQARQLASALENMAIIETVRAAALAEVERQIRDAVAARSEAEKMLREALKARIHALVLSITSVLICTLSLLAVWVI